MILQCWFRTIIKDDNISIQDIINIIIQFYNVPKILKWSRNLKSNIGFEYSDNDTLITGVKDEQESGPKGTRRYNWISPDIEPVNKGVQVIP